METFRGLQLVKGKYIWKAVIAENFKYVSVPHRFDDFFC